MRSLLPALLLAVLFVSAARADDHAVILIYHHVADDTPASTSVTPERFAAHLDFLSDNDFRVLPLEELLRSLDARRPLPENSVAITFDDAYLSVYNIARPMLEARGWPYTVFVSTEFIDKGYGNYVTWEQLRRMAENGATIGNHGVSHQSALTRKRGESREAWLERFRLDAVQAQERISAETRTVPHVYAWPYGEYNEDVEAVLAKLGWYGLGQQSGAAGYDDSMTAVPRFPIATNFADDDDFALRVRAEPLPVRITVAPGRLLPSGDPAPKLEFRLADGPFALAAVNCYNSRGERLVVSDTGAGALAIRSPTPLARGRSKYTCTAPHRGKRGVFGWYSHLWIVE